MPPQASSSSFEGAPRGTASVGQEVAQRCLASKANCAPHQEVQALGKCSFGRRKDAGEERPGLLARGCFGLLGGDVGHGDWREVV